MCSQYNHLEAAKAFHECKKKTSSEDLKGHRDDPEWWHTSKSQELQIINDAITYTIAQKAFQHDHGLYCKRSSNYGARYEVSEVRMSPKQSCSYDEVMEEPTISAEVGK